jgi:3-isopropylmalate/(R)-2-methylmalate dehydratase large subunit
MNITEKILAKNSGKTKVQVGEIINAKIDLIIAHDVTTPPAICMLEEKGLKGVFDPDKIVVTPDHFVPNKDIASAELAKTLRNWVKENGIKNYFEMGCHGICHAIAPEKGFVRPGQIVIGADSHTCTHGALGAFATGIGSTDLAFALYKGELWFRVPPTIKFVLNGKLKENVDAKDVILEIIRRISVSGARYKAMEFTGELIDQFSVEQRLTLCNMAIEAGGKSGIIAPDQKTVDYVNRASGQNLTLNDFAWLQSDDDAQYEEICEWDFSDLERVVACPHTPDNVKEVQNLEKIEIDQAYLGSCTNGRYSDLLKAAEVLKGKKIAENVRMLVIPATTDIWKKAMKEGLFDIFTEAGCLISTPTCGACLGGHMGILAEGERCISSTNRNFVGRMGHTKSEVYLGSPYTVAMSAIKGYIS